MINWDVIISILVLLTIVVIGYARIMGQTLPEIVSDIKEVISGGKEEAEEFVEGIIEYE